MWSLSNGFDEPFFAKLLAAFARQTRAGRDRIIVLQLDNVGWYGPKNVPVPMASGSSISPHAAPNSSRLSAYGLSSTSLSPTSTLPLRFLQWYCLGRRDFSGSARVVVHQGRIVFAAPWHYHLAG